MIVRGYIQNEKYRQDSSKSCHGDNFFGQVTVGRGQGNLFADV